MPIVHCNLNTLQNFDNNENTMFLKSVGDTKDTVLKNYYKMFNP